MTKQSVHRVLIFDSGIGGLSINDEIKKMIPNISVTYVADNRTYPYGTLSEQALIERIIDLFPKLIERFCPEAIVIACNSASTLVLDHLREQTDIPVIGVVPAIKPAAQLTRTHTIGLLATPGTVRRAYTDRLIQEFAPHCTVTKVGSHELVHEAENKLRGQPTDSHIIKNVVSPFINTKELDVLVLGCTHFPFLKEELTQILGTQITLLDSGEAIARRTRFILETLPSQKPFNPNCFIFTKEDETAHLLCPHLRNHGFEKIEFIHH